MELTDITLEYLEADKALEVAKKKAKKAHDALVAHVCQEAENRGDAVPEAGTLKCEGEDFTVTVTFRQNVTYTNKEALEELALNEELEGLFRCDFKERAAQVEKYLETHQGELAEALQAIRKKTKGKETLKIS